MTIRHSDEARLSLSLPFLSLHLSPPLSLPPTLLSLHFSPFTLQTCFPSVAPSNPLRSLCCSLKSTADLLFTITAIIYCSSISSHTKSSGVEYRGEMMEEGERRKKVRENERGGVKDVSRGRWQARRNTISHSLMWKLWFLNVCVCVWAHVHASVHREYKFGHIFCIDKDEES